MVLKFCKKGDDSVGIFAKTELHIEIKSNKGPWALPEFLLILYIMTLYSYFC